VSVECNCSIAPSAVNSHQTCRSNKQKRNGLKKVGLTVRQLFNVSVPGSGSVSARFRTLFLDADSDAYNCDTETWNSGLSRLYFIYLDFIIYYDPSPCSRTFFCIKSYLNVNNTLYLDIRIHRHSLDETYI